MKVRWVLRRARAGDPRRGDRHAASVSGPAGHSAAGCLAAYHQVRPEQVFVGNGSDEVLAHVFTALLKHDAPLLFPDITYSFYPVYCRLFGIAYEAVRLIRRCKSGLPTTSGRPARSSCPSECANRVALSRAEISTLLEQHPTLR